MAEENGPCSLTIGCSSFSVPRHTEVSEGKVVNRHNPEYCTLVPVGQGHSREEKSCHLNGGHLKAPWGSEVRKVM